MTLFQVRQWWEVSCGENAEEFDQHHLVVGNVDNDPRNVDKIVVASLQGIVRIYLPTQSQYKVEHLICESDLKQPVLQIALGRFVSNDHSNYLAVLHSRQLCVYAINAVGGFGEKAQYYELNKKYTHNLERNAFNFICGPFGQRQHGIGHYQAPDESENVPDSICVQSLDGKFWVFEQEQLAFARDWNNFLVPGCIAYAPFNDSIITMTAEMKLYSYSYAVLSTSEQQRMEDTAKNQKSSKSLHRNWCLNLCDHAVKVIVARFTPTISPKDHDIIVLCEKAIFAVSTSGAIKWQKKLEYNPSTMFAYRARSTNSGSVDNLIVANFQHSISIYSQCNLIWSARLPGEFSAVALGIGAFGSSRVGGGGGGAKGMQVLLSDKGQLVVGYLGTNPSGYHPVHVDHQREPDWEHIEQEMKDTKEAIRELEQNQAAPATDFLTMSIELGAVEWLQSGYINEQFDNELVCDAMARLKTVSAVLRVEYSGTGKSQSALSDIQISIDMDDAFVCERKQIDIEEMDAQHNIETFELRFFCRHTRIPHHRDCHVYAVYSNENDAMQTSYTSVALPFALLLSAASPIKNAAHSYTLEIGKEVSPPQPTELFSDLISPESKHEILRTPQALTVLFYCNRYDVTLLLSRKGGRMRIQSGSLDALWIVVDELVRRLHDVAAEKKQTLSLSLKDDLPLNEYLSLIETRYGLLERRRALEKNLERLSNQFRVIQKRLLTRFKNKNPTPLNQMDVLLQDTFQNIIGDTNQLEGLNLEMAAHSAKLWNLTRLMWLLMRVKYQLDEENMESLKAFLPIGTDEIEEGWEEQVEAGMVFALRTSLAKSVKDTKISQHKIGKIKDISKVIRHIRIVCDRLDKGQRFTDKPTF